MRFGRGRRKAPLVKGNATAEQWLGWLHGWAWRLASTVSAVGWMGVIFYLSASTPADLPQQLGMFAWLGKWRDVVGHLVLYGVLGPLLLVSLWSWVAGSSYRVKWVLVAAGLGILHGILDEYHQSFVPGRTATTLDVVIDSVGVVVSVAVVWYVVRGALLRHSPPSFVGED